MNEEKGMYERYAALFALRNKGGDTATDAIIDSLHAKSALLRHEVSKSLSIYWVLCSPIIKYIAKIRAALCFSISLYFNENTRV